MTAPETVIVVLAVLELLAVIGMGIAAFMMYGRVKTAAAWAQPVVQEAKAIAARGKATALETKKRSLTFYVVSRDLVQHVGQKVQTTTRLAREVVHPDMSSLQEAARAVAGPAGLVTRFSRLREAGKIAAGQGNGHDARR